MYPVTIRRAVSLTRVSPVLIFYEGVFKRLVRGGGSGVYNKYASFEGVKLLLIFPYYCAGES